MSSPDYDYIITGAGCAGLSLLLHWIDAGGLVQPRILLIDKAPKTDNDRTWCFWEKGTGLFEPIVHHHWEALWFHGGKHSHLKEIRPYRYKMIRGIDFYTYCFDRIRQQPAIDIRYGKVENWANESDGVSVTVDGKKITARFLFNSILRPPAGSPRAGYWHLLQHFKGWRIRTPRPVFQPAAATLMDFRVSQQQGTAFVYVMPFSETEALVEYTLFSEKLLEQQQYDAGLDDYIRRVLLMESYTVLEQEFGVIPMTNQPFPGQEGNIFHIGTAGGQTKPSSGYTFQFIQRQSKAIAQSLLQTGTPCSPVPSRRFHFYDSVLLNVLTTGKMDGQKIFTDLFNRNKITDLFCFLDNGSSWPLDLRIIGSLPFGPFLRAGWQQLLK